MKEIKLTEVHGGYWVRIDDKPYAWRSTETEAMLAEIGKHLLGFKIKVERA